MSPHPLRRQSGMVLAKALIYAGTFGGVASCLLPSMADWVSRTEFGQSLGGSTTCQQQIQHQYHLASVDGAAQAVREVCKAAQHEAVSSR